jgi:hypothetical protein
MTSARVAVLLVSREFLASAFIVETELPYFLSVRQAEGVKVIWVPVNHAMYEVGPLADIQAVMDPRSR